MVRHAVASVVGAVLLAAVLLYTPSRKVCEGFLPENDMRIDVGSFEDKGITQAQFNNVLDVVEKIYKPIVAAKGATLVIERKWDDGTVNAYAQQQGGKWMISMFGGLARHAAVTQDGFALVACHEMAHHLGGAPKGAGWFGSWASIEGQADYGGNLKCLRKVFTDLASAGFTRPLADDPLAVEACDKAFSSKEDKMICLRGSMGGKSVSALFKALSNDPKDPQFDTPDPAVVSAMYEKHPKTQCRMDTYLQGSICGRTVSEEVNDKDVFAGTCNKKTGQTVGIRPRCWYKPPADEPALMSVPVMAEAGKALSAPGSALSSLRGSDLWKGL
ncbi:MAG: hypothetical protein HZB91_01085 [Elusimicrobia bacterium]|nr:hypothetical protein [Elusimicrobiota bacterium]